MYSNKEKKLIFGSAGFGLPQYGFSSSNSPSDFYSYLKHMYNNGVKHIDTAPSYGHSERTIGIYHKNNFHKFQIWTKVDGLIKNSHFSFDHILHSVEESKKKLNVDKIECLYLHQNDINIIQDKFIQKALKEIKIRGLVKKVGVSIYSAEELKNSLFIDVYDVIQLPVSVANTYLYNIAYKLPHKKILVGRSIFLQGTLLNIENKKEKFNYYNEISLIIKLLKELAYSYKIDYLGMILSYVNSLENLKHIIISSKNKKNLNKILKNSDIELCDELKLKLNEISMQKNDWTNPRNWIV